MNFSRNYLSRETNLPSHLACLGARHAVEQTQLDEYPLLTTNLAVDLRDGVRLVKLAEVLLSTNCLSRTLRSPVQLPGDSTARENSEETQDSFEVGTTGVLPGSLMLLIRFPAISRLQKIHNVSVALRAFAEHCQPACVNRKLSHGHEWYDKEAAGTIFLANGKLRIFEIFFITLFTLYASSILLPYPK
ncbi:unnamed protein product [Protopolystoma xenopodis]|uniref:Calponin-homology (CH) domain-containing protein n=1 Tax=Protopolystoma xenopodis TaxID=117903 RepID=A0A3S5CV96_9PLAT|nr:unnamed protein product [Protopolystoma xenopodis]